ncbi:GNAT family N-acetyltransferase [Nocardioides sp. JQ2195]|uniref:bifunctional acetate--CoA ligase family protein/GNAT family N-acetyltransferase n=1 Tax=Nocardioides sp. JQ2195 TaxID=2592334 RepID=UPI00143E8669|nr:acetate--CoA ligase [Nocardioides sp. JQ2195]QIX26722.1 GNAT family N-acetyltransferase [Nocardioides sp. JQ2195]
MRLDMRPPTPESSARARVVPGPAPADVLLTDGSVATIRVATPDDLEPLHALHAGVSDDNLRLRFFSSSRAGAKAYVEHLGTCTDTLTLVVERAGSLVAVGTAEPTGPEVAEVAFLVDDAQHGLGLGSLLLEHLAAAGRALGIRRFVAEVLVENHGMLRVFTDAGFAVERQVSHGEVHVEMDTVNSAGALAAADERERQSEVCSLRPLLHPRSVAVAGVRRDGTGIGATILHSVIEGGFTGEVYAVHPTATQIGGVTARPLLTALPEVVDLVVVAVPAERVLATLEDATEAGVRAAVIVSSGFQELGADGTRMQREILALARARNIRVVGPNCLGLMINDPDISLDATFSGSVPPPGGLAVASQSGGVGIVLSDLARELGLGVGVFVSLGNKADVSSNDLLAAWQEDPRVTGAALYLESFGNAPKFARFARRFAERKPLLAVVGGRSVGGQRAGASHTAAAASSSVGVDALFAQAGVIACNDAEELAETALLLGEQPLPAGNRIAILSNAGGMGVLAADGADSCGLHVPELSDSLRERIADLVPGTTGTGNPIDAGAGAGPARLAAICSLLMASDEVDAVVVVIVATGVSDPTDTLDSLAGAVHEGKPLVLVPMGGLEVAHGDLPGVTTFRSVRAAVRSLGRAARYAAWRAQPVDAPAPVLRDRAERARRGASTLLETRGQETGWLDVEDVVALLGDYGLAPTGEVVTGPDAAVAVAEALGCPVAVKVADRGVVHKTDRGLVRVGLTSAHEVREAARGFATELGRRDASVLVQPMESGVEMALGVIHDPVFGALVMVGAGGVATDLWDDRVFLLPPVTAGDAARALRTLRVWPLLEGFRGAPRADVPALEAALVRLGQLAEDVPQLAEIDLNPVLAGPRGCAFVDVKVRLDEPVALDAGVPRRLRRGL